MKLIFLFISFLLTAVSAQTAQDFFDASADAYVKNNNELALSRVKSGLIEFPADKKLIELKAKIETKKEQEQQQKKENETGENEEDESQQPPEENENQNQSGEQDGRNQGEQGSGSNEEKLQSGEEQINNDSEAMNKNLEEFRQNQLLEALEQQEQNTQKKLMMGKTRKKLFRNEKDW